MRYNYRRHGARFLLQGIAGVLRYSLCNKHNSNILINNKERLELYNMLESVSLMLNNFLGDPYNQAIREDAER